MTPKTVTHGKAWGNDEGRFGAFRAVDNNLATFSLILTDNGAGWLKLKFDKTYFFNKVVIYYRFYTNWYDPDPYFCFQSEAIFRTCVDRENNADVSVYQEDVEHFN